MNLFGQLDREIEESFRKIVSKGWKLKTTIIENSGEFSKISDEQNRLQNYYQAVKVIKEIIYANTTPSGKIDLSCIFEDLLITEIMAVLNENYELAHKSQIYQRILASNWRG